MRREMSDGAMRRWRDEARQDGGRDGLLTGLDALKPLADVL